MADQAGRPSVMFSAPDADVTFLSNDGVIYKIHKSNLEFMTGGFPPAETNSQDEMVQLTETSETLDLLFQFVYPRRQPDLESMEFSILALLAEAAEKYQVYSAMSICKICMKQTLPNHALEILVYAGRHEYPDILDKAAPACIRLSLVDVVKALPPHLIMAWIAYHEEWSQAVRTAISNSKKLCGCAQSRLFLISVIRELHVGSIQEMDTMFDSTKDSEQGLSLTCCVQNKQVWRSWTAALVEEIPSFSMLRTQI